MKILIVNRFFGGAQIPTGRMAEDVALKLVEAGHEVSALASTGTYAGAEKLGGDESRVTSGGWNEAAYSAGSDTEPKHHGTETPPHRGTLRVAQVRVPTWMPRALAWLWFTWQARKRIPQMEWDVCVLMTDPPLLPLLARRIRRKAYGTRHIAVWLMDLYPEALAASGRITKSNPLYRWYFNKRQKALAASDLLLFLGETQKALVGKCEGEKVGRWEGSNREQGTGDGKQVAGKTERPNYRPTETPTPPLTQCVRTAVVPPWDDRGNIALATEESLQNLALYAGNLGEAHCFEEILAAAPYLPADWTIRFAARGAKRSALLSKLRSDEWRVTGDESGSASAFAPANDSGVTSGSLKLTDLKLKTAGAVVHVSGYASEEETPELLASARVHLITMSPGWEGIVVPSKLYGCIRTGRPVLFIGPENADTAREIRANDWGKVLPPGASGEEVASAILNLAKRPTSSAQVRNGAQLVAKSLEGLADKCSSTTEHQHPVTK